MAKKRVLYFDLLNICAALCVIFLHCNGKARDYSETLGWYQALGIEVICYWAVPVFLMLTGATLMGYRDKYSTTEFFKKRVFRTVVPFVLWSIINAIVKDINPLDIGWRMFINRFFNSSIENVYWFFIPLFSVYLSMPILSLLKDNKKILWYMAGGALLLNNTFPQVFSYLGLKWNGSLSMMTVSGLMIYPIIGYLLATTDFSKVTRYIIYALGIGGAGLRYFMTVFLTKQDGKINQSFFSYTAYYAILLSVAVFVLFKYLPINKWIESKEKLCKAISTISSCSFGVYLIHMFVLRGFASIMETGYWYWRLFFPIIIYIVALVIVFVVKKIPVIKNIFP